MTTAEREARDGWGVLLLALAIGSLANGRPLPTPSIAGVRA